jgi:hypothetical protein
MVSQNTPESTSIVTSEVKPFSAARDWVSQVRQLMFCRYLCS